MTFQPSSFKLPYNNLFGDEDASPSDGLDSITLGQLKAMVNSAPKPKQPSYEFRYEDEDTVMSEIEEFYAFKEAPQIAENLRAWEGSFPGEWINSSPEQRLSHVRILLESLEHKNSEIRFTNARRLYYLLQGAFAETTAPEHQLHWIIENCKTTRAANGIGTIMDAMVLATSKHDLLCALSDADLYRFNIAPNEKHDCIEDLHTELSVYFGMLYLLVEVLKDHDGFADELMSLDPPFPVCIFNVTCGLRDKGVKTYPVKKLLLLLWKAILACCGGSRDLLRVKKISRELAGLSEEPEESVAIKSSPLDIQTFRQETSVKYPTFTPPPPVSETSFSIAGPDRVSSISISPLKLAEAFAPIPVRHHYHHADEPDFQPPAGLPNSNQQSYPPANPVYNPNPTPQPMTPMPTPPPSPKPKKQQYQTDQNRPFLFPFSRSQLRGYRSGADNLVPFAIEEADMLYKKHIHISVPLLQMWRTREECMIEESGLQRTSGTESDFDTFDSVLSFNSGGGPPINNAGLDAPGADRHSAASAARDDAGDPLEELPDVILLNSKIAEINDKIKEINNASDKDTAKKLKELKERQEDLLRLKRVEQIYVAVLPVLPGCVVVLLKFLLAAIQAVNSAQPPPSASSAAFPPGVPPPEQQPPPPPPTLEELDAIRHREIVAKAVSAILLLTLKWFKASHVMKFHYFGQLLLESNCLLLILKMFTMHDMIPGSAKTEPQENSFFGVCHKYSKNPQAQRPEDDMLGLPKLSISRPLLHTRSFKTDDDAETLTDFSWRNLFSSINFIKVMQKLSKHRSHRIWLLVQYKSSAVLKRVTTISQPLLQLQVLKLIKSQVPYCGRKWRQSNMKMITAIYLNCRPDLRDEWLTGAEVDDAQDALAQEQALRKLVKYYNNKRYGFVLSHAASRENHRRSSSLSVPLDALHPGPELSAIVRSAATPNTIDADVFPPLRAQAPDPSIFLRYTTEDIAFEEEYEEYLSDLGMSDEHVVSDGALFGGTSAWHRLPYIGSEIADGISDSESIASIGELGDEAKFDASVIDSDHESVDENRNNWEHMSPKTMAALPKSPVGVHRRSNSGSNLRPVLPFGLDDNSAIDLEEMDEEEMEMGPMPREQSGPFAQGAGVDEVEYAYGL